MQSQTLKLLSGLVPLLGLLTVGTIFGLRAIIDYETRIRADISFNSGQNSNPANTTVNTTEPTPTQLPLPQQSPSPTSTVEHKQKTEKMAGNITGYWISEVSEKPYFFTENNNNIEIYENDSGHQSIKSGNGVRNKNEITAQFYSDLDEVDGTLELEVSEDGKTMTGRFTERDNPTKGAIVRMRKS